MPKITVRQSYSFYANDTDTIPSRKVPALTLDIADIEEITLFRHEPPLITTRKGEHLLSDNNIAVLFGAYAQDEKMREKLKNIRVYAQSFYEDAQGRRHDFWDECNVEGFIPLPKFTNS